MSDKKLRKFALLFRAGDPSTIREAIESLRNEPPFAGAISLLVSLYNRTNLVSLKSDIESFFNDLKNQSVAAEVIEEIRKEKNPDTLRMLISSCWQSSLDYSSYYTDIADTFHKGDYSVALECFTVLTESASGLKSDEKDTITKMIGEKYKTLNPDKQNLADKLFSILGK